MSRSLALLLLAVAAGGLVGGSGAGAAPTEDRIVFASEWGGPTQVYATSPAAPRRVAQVTFDRVPPTCVHAFVACGLSEPVPSPDGRRLVYRTAGDVPSGGQFGGSYWIARADGRGARKLPGEAVTGSPAGVSTLPAWSPDSTQLAYHAPDGLHVVRANGSADRVVRPSGWHPAWSRDGALALIDGESLVVVRGGRSRTLVHDGVGRPWPGDYGFVYDARNRPWWSPDGRRIAFRSRGRVAVVDARTGRVTTFGRGFPAGWSPTRGLLAYVGANEVGVLDVGTGRRTREPVAGATEAAWSADGVLLAYAGQAGIGTLDARTGRTRRLTADVGTSLAWAPDRALLAYVLPRAVDGASFQEIRTVTPAGKVRVVVPATGAYGGQLVGFGWLRPVPGVRFREPEPVEGVYAGGRITRLATDAGSVAMVSCGRVLVWRPPGAPLRVDDRADGGCSDGDRANVPQALAVAGDRVAYQVTYTGLGYLWELVLATAIAPVQRTRLASGSGNLGRTPDGAAGSGPLLAYSSYPGAAGTEQALYRVAPDGSSTRIKTEPVGDFGAAPLDPLDADAGRILTRSSYDFLRVVDGEGRTLLAISVVPGAAALAGNDVVAVVGGELRDYDATTGALLRAWPAPDLLRGHGYVDTAHGLVAYTTAAGEVLVHRLADGRDAVVGPGAIARFLDGGLAVADGARLRIVPDARLDGLLAAAAG